MMLKPEVLEALMAMDSYEDFNLGLEHGPHLAIPQSIRGDFSLLTAPSGKLALIIRRFSRLTAISKTRFSSCITPNSIVYGGDGKALVRTELRGSAVLHRMEARNKRLWRTFYAWED